MTTYIVALLDAGAKCGKIRLMNRLKQMKQQIKAYEQRQQPLPDYLKTEYLDATGVAVVDVNLAGQTLYNPLTMGQQQDLDPALYATIDEKVYNIPSIVPVMIRCHGVAPKEQSRVQSLFNKHYDFILRDKKQDLRRNAIKSWLLYLLGIALLALYFVLAKVQLNVVGYEVLSIVATFIIWEATDAAILQRHSLRVAYLEAAQMALAQYTFVNTTRGK